MKRITGAKSERLLIIAMCILWLEETNVQYGMSTVDEETAAREQDANDRYNNTNALIILFCRTKYADKGLDFLWSGLSADEQVTTSFVVEHIVLETLTIEACLPLNLVLDSWVTFHLLSVAIRNDGKRKKSKRPVVSYLLIVYFINISIIHLFFNCIIRLTSGSLFQSQTYKKKLIPNR